MTRTTHFIGIGGIGMSGLARLLLQKGEEVSGSDLKETALTQSLEHAGATVYQGHHADNVPTEANVVFSSAVGQDNPEFQAAQKWKCKLLHRGELLADLVSQSETIAIAGSHGKTTTSALLTHVLRCGGAQPSYYVGGVLKDTGDNAGLGKGKYFVTEVDESDGSFLKMHPQAAILTNVEAEHLDYYQTEEGVRAAFRQFAGQVKNQDLFVWCGDDPGLSSLDLSGTSYGLTESCDVQGLNVRQRGWTMLFDVQFGKDTWSDIELNLVGRHNVQNAVGVIAMAQRLGVEESKIREALRSFSGVKRRCDLKGEVDGVMIIDDYAHHPTEIRTTLDGIRRAVPARRLIAVFQPHRYSRTQDCRAGFASGFARADAVVVTDICAAGEEPIPGVSATTVLREIESRTDLPVHYVARSHMVDDLFRFVQSNDLVVFLGAGNITQVSDELLRRLSDQTVVTSQ